MGEFLGRYWVFCLIASAAVIIPIFRIRRAHTLLLAWRVANGYEIISRKWAGFRVGPFPLAALGHQAVYRLLVRDREGKEHICWIKLGDFVVGLLSNEVEVKWEEDDKAALG
jgi:hypothetical protein